MNRVLTAHKKQRLAQFERVAEDIMTPNPVSIDHAAKVRHAASVLAERAISAVPVINRAGRPVGVISRADIVRVAGSELSNTCCPLSCEYCSSSTIVPRNVRSEELDPAMCACPTVSDTMTPEVYSIGTDTPVLQIIEKLLSENVNRLFVIDREGTLVGVVTALDVIRSLRRCTQAA